MKKYAWVRLSVCRFGEEKPACSNCSVHCYKTGIP
ncbi:MAG: nitrous oxide-stimulated promoter family protein [Caldibacillus sp.]